VLLAGLFAWPTSAGAYTHSASDGNDSASRLDISKVLAGHNGMFGWVTITTFQTWPSKALQVNSKTFNAFAVGFDTNRDGKLNYIAYIFFSGKLRGVMTSASGKYLYDLTDLSRDNARSVTLNFQNKDLKAPGYYWDAASFFTAAGACKNTCVDVAPNRTLLLQDVTAPTITGVSSIPGVLTNTATSSSLPLSFTVADKGWSGLAGWHVQSSSDDSHWTDVEHGAGLGSETLGVSLQEGTQLRYRLYAADKQGNEVTTASHLITVPFDDGNDVFSSSYAGDWAMGGTSQDYDGTLHTSATPGSTFTYSWTSPGSAWNILWIAPGGGSWTASVTVDGGAPYTVNGTNSTAAPRQQVSWQSGSGTGTSHTMIITVTSGTVPIDGIYVNAA